jgi:hypothetical protein
VIGVDRWIQARQLIVEWQIVAVLFDEFGDVVAYQRDGKARERSGDGRA